MQHRDSSRQPLEKGIPSKRDEKRSAVGQPTPAAPLALSYAQEPHREQTAADGPHWPPTAEWALVYVTVPLAIFTFLLWAATRKLVVDANRTAVDQGKAMEGQRVVMAAQQAAMEAQASAAAANVDALKAQVAAMEGIAAAVAASAEVSREAVASVRDQLALQKRMFVASNQPALVMRDVRFEERGEEHVIVYTLSNSGLTDAVIVDHRATDFWRGKVFPSTTEPEYRAASGIALGGRLRPGEPQSCTHVCDSTEERTLARYMMLAGDLHGEWYFSVLVDYDDENGTRSEVSFGWKYDRARKAFVAHKEAF